MTLAKESIPSAVCSVVGRVLGESYYNHTRLNALFLEAGAPGDPPEGNCVTKCTSWLKRCNGDPAIDALAILGEVLVDFMDAWPTADDPSYGESKAQIQMKGWTVVLVAAILVLLARENRSDATFVALAPIFIFWALDGYFLWQERLYRALYNHVRTLEEARIDFAMNVSPFRTGYLRSWPGATLSRTLLAFYGALIATVGLATTLLNDAQGVADEATGVLQLPL